MGGGGSVCVCGGGGGVGVCIRRIPCMGKDEHIHTNNISYIQTTLV